MAESTLDDIKRRMRELEAVQVQREAEEARRKNQKDAKKAGQMITSRLELFDGIEQELKKVHTNAQSSVESIQKSDQLTDKYKRERIRDVRANARAEVQKLADRATRHRDAAMDDIDKLEHAHRPTAHELVAEIVQQSQARDRVRALLDNSESVASVADRAAKVGDLPALRALKAEYTWRASDPEFPQNPTQNPAEYIDRATAPLLPEPLAKAIVGRYDIDRAHARTMATVDQTRALIDGDDRGAMTAALQRHYT